MSTKLPAIPFSSWLRQMEDALAERQATDVPCGSCTACCRTSHFVHVRAEERRTLRRVPRQLLFPAPGLPPGTMVLGYDETGCCPLLVCSRCSIYEDRPIACRTYDCRVYAAAEVPADRPAIAERVAHWRFGHPTTDDRRLHDAVRAAARVIGDPQTSPLGVAVRNEPVRVAVLAIAVHGLFLPDARGESGARPAGPERGRAVIAAHERLFGDLLPQL